MFKDINTGAKCRVDLEISWSLGEKGAWRVASVNPQTWVEVKQWMENALSDSS